jgi:hypothetical protein
VWGLEVRYLRLPDYSLIETAKANGLEPYNYILHVLSNIATADTVEKLEALLPWNVKDIGSDKVEIR